MSDITAIISNIQSALKAPKGQTNTFGKYKYRSCEDIVEAVKPLLVDYDAALVIRDEMVQLGERFYVKATAEIWIGNESFKSTAYAREPLARKGMDEAQITGATSSYARKYALNGLLAIDDTKDADSHDNRNIDSRSSTQKSKDHAQTNMNGTEVDIEHLQTIVDEAKRIVDEYESDPETGVKLAKELYEAMNNDERMWVGGKLGSVSYKNPNTGRMVKYSSGFKAYVNGDILSE